MLPASLSAQAAESSEYRTLVEQALIEYADKNYEEASSLFARAHQLEPNARTLRGLGMAAFELRRYPESIVDLEAALASNERALDSTLRSETAALLQRARGFVATVTVDLVPQSAELLVDGNRAEPFAPLSLSLGEHVFELRQSGRVRERRVVRLRGGEVSHLRLAVGVGGADTSAARADKPEHDRKRPLYKNGWLWAGVGAVVAGSVTASVLVATRSDDKTVVVPSATTNTPPGVSLRTAGLSQ
jgi:tetratricopeptide (TPR) repeat protein